MDELDDELMCVRVVLAVEVDEFDDNCDESEDRCGGGG